MHPKACGIPKLTSHCDNVLCISDSQFGNFIRLGQSLKAITVQTCGIILEAVDTCIPNVLAVILKDPVSFR